MEKNYSTATLSYGIKFLNAVLKKICLIFTFELMILSCSCFMSVANMLNLCKIKKRLKIMDGTL